MGFSKHRQKLASIYMLTTLVLLTNIKISRNLKFYQIKSFYRSARCSRATNFQFIIHFFSKQNAFFLITHVTWVYVL